MWTVLGSYPGGSKIFPHPSRLALEPIQPLIQWVPGGGVKWLWRYIDHARPSSSEVEGRVEIYVYSLTEPSWPVGGWTSFYIFNQWLVAMDIHSDWLCKVTIHFVSSCKILASIECRTRHDGVCKQIHKEILLKNSVIFISLPCYYYQKVSSGRYKICWNKILITNKEIQLNKPNIKLAENSRVLHNWYSVPFYWEYRMVYNNKIQKCISLANNQTAVTWNGWH